MTEVLFGQSYYLRFDPKLWQAMQPYPPLGTLYAASYLRQRGYDVALYDAMLADDYGTHADPLKHDCSDDTTTDADSLWYHYYPQGSACQTRIKAELAPAEVKAEVA